MLFRNIEGHKVPVINKGQSIQLLSDFYISSRFRFRQWHSRGGRQVGARVLG